MTDQKPTDPSTETTLDIPLNQYHETWTFKSWIKEYILVGPDVENNWEIIKWWEIRRFIYNGVMFVCGISSLFWTGLMGYLIGPAGDMDFLAIFMIPIFAIAANICYTSGWVIQVFLVGKDEIDRKFAVRAFIAGTLFSLMIVLAPAALATIAYIATWFGYNPNA